jgi:peptidoglycan/LPS O-acetylase OafA/YrhL
LLLQEKSKNNNINITKFYLRRIFRIWPLYYLIIIISFFLIPFLSSYSVFSINLGFESFINDSKNYTFKNLFLFISFLPQFASIVIGASQTWSIGLEEQFYLIVPLVVKFLNRKNLLYSIVLCMLLYSIQFFEIDSLKNLNSITQNFIKFLEYFNFMYLCIGVFGGYLYFYHSKEITKYTKSKYLYFTVILMLLCLTFFKIFDTKFNNLIVGFLFLILLYFTINSLNSGVFRNAFLNYIGKISYGIYMYHVFVIFLVFPFAKKYFIENKIASFEMNLIVYFFCYFLTILFSFISYEFFESKFVNFKDKKFKV